MNIRKWCIYRANLEPVVESEQGKSRPVLIISEDEINNLLNVVNVLPITSRKVGRRLYPNEALLEIGDYGLINESIVLCHQIRTLDKRRLKLQYGEILNTAKQNQIIEALCFQLGIEK